MAYRKELTEMFAVGTEFDNLVFTKRILSDVSNDAAKKWAIVGW